MAVEVANNVDSDQTPRSEMSVCLNNYGKNSTKMKIANIKREHRILSMRIYMSIADVVS